MTSNRGLARQSGFFAAGFALVVLAVFGAFGATAVTVLEEKPKSEATAQIQSASVPAKADTGSH